MAEVVMVPLECETTRSGGKRLAMRERIARLVCHIKRVSVQTAIDHRDTLAYIVFDGLSASESFFMEALYESDHFPCLFVGGSAGGRGDFNHVVVKQIRALNARDFTGYLDTDGMDEAVMPVFDGLSELGRVLAQANDQQQEIADQLQHYSGELHLSMDDSLRSMLDTLEESSRQTGGTAQRTKTLADTLTGLTHGAAH